MIQKFSLVSFAVGFVLGAALVGVWFFSAQFMPPVPAQTRSPLATSSSLLPSGTVSVSDQTAGTEVVVASVTVPPPGVWVAVREMDGNELGSVLGAARVRGPKTNISIPLLRTTEPSHSYAIELYRDDAGETFDPSQNSVYVDLSTGARVVSYFKTTE